VPDVVGVVRGGVPRRAEDVGDLVGVMVCPVAGEVEARAHREHLACDWHEAEAECAD
jgi:hypothetical protein